MYILPWQKQTTMEMKYAIDGPTSLYITSTDVVPYVQYTWWWPMCAWLMTIFVWTWHQHGPGPGPGQQQPNNNRNVSVIIFISCHIMSPAKWPQPSVYSLDSLRITQIVPSPVQCLPHHRGDPTHNPTKKFLYSFFHLLHIFSVMAFFEFWEFCPLFFPDLNFLAARAAQ